MPVFLTEYIISHGYLTIFLIVFLQELGVPGLPNELMLFYAGYLCHKSGLSYPLVACLVVIADTTGSFILYLVFYHFKKIIVGCKPGWLRLPAKKIAGIKQRILLHGARNIFIAKLTPFIRGYLPVVAGILQVQPVLYVRIILLTAIIWSGGWVTAGWLLHF